MLIMETNLEALLMILVRDTDLTWEADAHRVEKEIRIWDANSIALVT